MRLPFLDKQFTAFEGSPPPPSQSFPIVQFYVGEDIVLDLPLELNGATIDLDHWTLTATMRASVNSVTSTWLGTVGSGIDHDVSNPYLFSVIVPSKLTSMLSPGTYWIDLVLKEQLGKSKTSLDRKVLLSRIPVSLDYSASSCKPEQPSPPAVDTTLV